MNKYIINKKTIALIPLFDETKIIEYNKKFIIKKNIIKILDESCKYYYSSLKGRIEGSKYLLNICYKSPIIVSENKKIIMFPTTSLNDKNCIWINNNYIRKSNLNNNYILFKNGFKLKVNISNRILNNQMLKSSKLELILKSKK